MTFTLPDMGDDVAWMRTEHEVLLRFLNKMRAAVIRTTEGLIDKESRTPGVPSGTNLLGTLKHLTWCEKHWFGRIYLDEEIAGDRSMAVAPDVTRDDLVTAYRQACRRSDEIVRGCPDLSTLAAIAHPGEDGWMPLRAIVVHMIEETGRHAGHADILRELIDGMTERSPSIT
jgi:uncharacterized damage-inducible protein DinB